VPALCQTHRQTDRTRNRFQTVFQRFRARHIACFTARPMNHPVFSTGLLIALSLGVVSNVACSSGDSTSSGGSAASGAAGAASQAGLGGSGGGGTAAGGTGVGGGGASAGGETASGGSFGSCTPSNVACSAKGSSAADNCHMGATCCDGTTQRTCVCAAETCTYYFFNP
jgi:hypothetical protein